MRMFADEVMPYFAPETVTTPAQAGGGSAVRCIIPSIMTSERMQRRVERLLDQADEASDAFDWERV